MKHMILEEKMQLCRELAGKTSGAFTLKDPGSRDGLLSHKKVPLQISLIFEDPSEIIATMQLYTEGFYSFGTPERCLQDMQKHISWRDAIAKMGYELEYCGRMQDSVRFVSEFDLTGEQAYIEKALRDLSQLT